MIFHFSYGIKYAGVQFKETTSRVDYNGIVFVVHEDTWLEYTITLRKGPRWENLVQYEGADARKARRLHCSALRWSEGINQKTMEMSGRVRRGADPIWKKRSRRKGAGGFWHRGLKFPNLGSRPRARRRVECRKALSF